jgi:hypothetical protein
MNNGLLILSGIVLIVVLNIYSIIKSYIKYGSGRCKFEIKKFVNSFQPLVSMTLYVYALLYWTILSTMIIEKIIVQSDNSWVVNGFGVFVVVVACYLMIKMWKSLGADWLKYNDMEKEWIREDKLSNYNKLPQLLKSNKYIKRLYGVKNESQMVGVNDNASR